MHRKDKDGNYVPLNVCERKVRKKRKSAHGCCKAGFPKSNLLTTKTVLICQGMARKFNLRVSGRRNAFGLWQGKRHEAWQSGTTKCLAVEFRSNSHTMPNYRLPPMEALHEASCPSAACRERAKNMLQHAQLRDIARLQQRVQREATGYC